MYLKGQNMRINITSFFLSLSILLPIFLNQIAYAEKYTVGQPTEITVTSETTSTQAFPIGANLSTIMGGTNLAINNSFWNSGFEPIFIRKFVRINRAGTNWFEWDQEGGPGYWNLAWTGFLNGATVRFYRIVDKNNQPLSYNLGKNMGKIDGADHVVFLGESKIPAISEKFPSGGYIANDGRDGVETNDQERVFITDDNLGLTFGDYAYITLKTFSIPENTSPPDLRKKHQGAKNFFFSNTKNWTATIEPHNKELLPENFVEPGDSCLKVVIDHKGKFLLKQFAYTAYSNKKAGQWYSQLSPGKTYRVSVWLRQQNLSDNGKAKVVFGEDYDTVSQEKPWKITEDWQQFTYDFTAPKYPESEKLIFQGLQFTGPGTVWIDNLLLYEYDGEKKQTPFSPHPISFNAFMAAMPEKGHKAPIRFNRVIYHPAQISSMFGNYGNTSYQLSAKSGVKNAPGMTIAQALDWALHTGESPSDRSTPILTCNEEYTEDEWKALIEFLGVPYDPALDTPDNKPYAYKRYLFRNGNGRPWTDEFDEIIVEYGNETWHNGAGGYGWHGWGKPGAVHKGGIEYGLFTKFMFDDNVKKMPEWEAYHLNNKIKFMLGGNYRATSNSYGELAAQQRNAINYLGHANYVGPKWETKDKGKSTFSDYGIQMTLLGLESRMKGLIQQAEKTSAKLKESQLADYQIIAYEGGPSGYWTNKKDPIIDELYGKSVAMGVAALDTWLFSSQHGYKYQAFHALHSGEWWSSHTPPEAGGFRPCPGWLTLTMRNKYVDGTAMLKTVQKNTPMLTDSDNQYSLLSSYAFEGEKSYSVFIISKVLDGKHGSGDFGDGYTAVTLNLPFTNVKSITRYRLENLGGQPADPRDNNIERLNVVIGKKEISPDVFNQRFVINELTGGEAKGLAPGSVNLYVFKTDALSN